MEKKNGKFVATLSFLRATKRTYRFDEDATSDGYLRSLYVEQRAFKKEPKKLRVTVEVIA